MFHLNTPGGENLEFQPEASFAKAKKADTKPEGRGQSGHREEKSQAK